MAMIPRIAAAAGQVPDAHFKQIFDLSPIPTWEQDYTEIIEMLERHRANGVTDIVEFLMHNRDELKAVVGAVKVNLTNTAAIETFQYDPGLHGGRIQLHSEGAFESFAHQVAAVWNGDSELYYEYYRDPDHAGPSQCALHWTALDSHDGPDYTQVVLSIADVAARNTLTEQIQRRSAKLELLHEINREVASQLDVDVVLGTIVEGVKRIIDADWVELLILDDMLESIVEQFRVGLTNEAPDVAELRSGIGGWVLQSRTATLSPAAQSDPRNTGAALQRAVADGIGALVIAPLTINGTTRGTLAAGSRDGAAVFTSADLELVSLMAAHASFAVQNVMAVARIEEQIAGRDRMTATVSHELRTPLTSIGGLAAALSDDWDSMTDDERREIANLIVRESEDATAIVEDLLTVARSELHQMQLGRVPMELLSQTEAVVQALEDGHDGTLATAGRQVAITADPVRVRQIIRNLVTNAIRYGGKEIRLEVSATDDAGVLQVFDDGHGVDPEVEEALFTPFSRGVSEVAGSVGLGLSVSKNLAEAMGGTLVYERTDDTTIFTLSLPTT